MALSRRAFLGASLGAAAMAAAPSVLAQESQLQLASAYSQTHTQYFNSAYEAARQSRKYARENNAIGFVVAYGPYENAPTPEAVGEKFREQIALLGEQSQFFIAQIETPGYSLFFDNPHTGTDAMSIPEAAGSLSKIVAEKKRFDGYTASIGASYAR